MLPRDGSSERRADGAAAVLPVEEILESLSLRRAEPDAEHLEALFLRFNARVPFETASKILRRADSAATDKPRLPPLFWSEHLRSGSGDTCFGRVAAFEALLRALGFASRKVLGRCGPRNLEERWPDVDHAAILVTAGARRWICDVGFPLPVLLPAEEGHYHAPTVDCGLSRIPAGYRVSLLTGVPAGRPAALEIFEADVTEQAFHAHWAATFGPTSRLGSTVALRRHEADRIVSFAAGCVRVDRGRARLTIPVLRERPSRVAEIFRVDRQLLERAFILAGDPAPATEEPCLTLYMDAPPPPAPSAEGRPGPQGSSKVGKLRVERHIGRSYVVGEARLTATTESLLETLAAPATVEEALREDLRAWTQELEQS